MNKVSELTYNSGCAISSNKYYIGSTLDDYSEFGFSRMMIFEFSECKWYFHDLRFTVIDVCLQEEYLEGDKYVLSLGVDGETDKYDGINSKQGYIKNAGLNAEWSSVLGYLKTIRIIGNEVFACGSSGQIYKKKIDSDNWVEMHITFDENSELLKSIDFDDKFPDVFEIELFDINGISNSNLYAVGRIGVDGLIAHYNGVDWNILPRITPSDLNSISLTNDNDILICGDHGNLIRGNYLNGFERLTSKGISHNFYNAADYKDSIYIASEKYLYKFKDGMYSKVMIREDLNDLGFLKVEQINDILWVLMEKYLIRFDGVHWEVIENPDNLNNFNKIESVKAGITCPQSGYWFTVAKENSRQYFNQGDVFPEVQSDWGDVFWQFDGEK